MGGQWGRWAYQLLKRGPLAAIRKVTARRQSLGQGHFQKYFIRALQRNRTDRMNMYHKGSY